MVNFLNLPTAQAPRNALMDFSPVNNAIDGNRRNALAVQEGQRQDQELTMRKDEHTYQRGRDQKQDAWQQMQRAGQVADAIQRMPDTDPAKAAAWQRYLKTYGDGDHGPEELDFRTGPKLAAAAVGKWRDPREDEAANLDLQYKRAQINQMTQKQPQAPELSEIYDDQGRKQKVMYVNGQYVPVGGSAKQRDEMLTAGDRKAIAEADDKTQANASAITTLEQALNLNKTANAGWGAGIRSSVANNLPDLLVPDAISSPQSGQAAAELDNAIIGNALEQLKATFGGMPTEGERKILIDIQGSINQPREVRAAIYNRALALARNRLEINKQEAEKMRGGTYYKPGGAVPIPQAAPPAATDLKSKYGLE